MIRSKSGYDRPRDRQKRGSSDVNHGSEPPRLESVYISMRFSGVRFGVATAGGRCYDGPQWFIEERSLAGWLTRVQFGPFHRSAGLHHENDRTPSSNRRTFSSSVAREPARRRC